MTTIAELVERASRRYADAGRRRRRRPPADVRRGRRSLDPARQRAAGTLARARLPGRGPHGQPARVRRDRLRHRASAGKVKAPINPRLTDDERSLHPRELRRRGAGHRSGPRSSGSSRMRGWAPELRHVVVVDGADDSYGDLLASASALPSASCDRPRRAEHDPAHLGHDRPAEGRDDVPAGPRLAGDCNMLLDEFSRRRTTTAWCTSPRCRTARDRRSSPTSSAVPETSPWPSSIRSCSSRRCPSSGGTSTFVVPTMIRMLLDAPDCTPASCRASATSPTAARRCPSRSPRRRSRRSGRCSPRSTARARRRTR